MSSRRSDNLKVLEHRRADRHDWSHAVLSNLSLLVAIAAMWGLSFLVESRWFGAYNQRITMLIGFNVILAVSLQLINGFSGQFSLGHAGFMAIGAYLAAYPAINLSSRLTDPFRCLWFYLALAVLVAAVGFSLLLIFWGVRATRRFHASLPMVLLLALLAWLLIDLSGASSGRFSWWERIFSSVASGFTWLLAHGDKLGRISTALPASIARPVCFVILVIGGGACAGVVGLIVGMPALRLRGDYLAIATLGFAEIIRILIQNSQPLGGALGLTNIPKYTDFTWLYAFVVITIAVIWRVAYSSKGRAIMAVREDEIAASATGVDPTHYKVVAFIIGSFFGGVAGALFALHERSIAPYQFGLQKSIEIVVMVTLGGLGSISGAVLVAVILTVLPELLRPVADLRMIIYSLLLIFMMLLRPQGLLGGRELWFKRRATIAPTLEAPDPDGGTD